MQVFRTYLQSIKKNKIVLQNISSAKDTVAGPTAASRSSRGVTQEQVLYLWAGDNYWHWNFYLSIKNPLLIIFALFGHINRGSLHMPE